MRATSPIEAEMRFAAKHIGALVTIFMCLMMLPYAVEGQSKQEGVRLFIEGRKLVNKALSRSIIEQRQAWIADSGLN